MNPCESSNLSFSAQTLGNPTISEGILFFGDNGNMEENGAKWRSINTAINTIENMEKGRCKPSLFFLIRYLFDSVCGGNHIGWIRMRVTIQHFS